MKRIRAVRAQLDATAHMLLDGDVEYDEVIDRFARLRGKLDRLSVRARRRMIRAKGRRCAA